MKKGRSKKKEMVKENDNLLEKKKRSRKQIRMKGRKIKREKQQERV